MPHRFLQISPSVGTRRFTMAGFGVTFVVSMVLFLPHGAVGASLTASDTVIRREGVKPARVMDRMSMSPRGELLQAKPDAKQPTETFQDSSVKFDDEMTDEERRSRAQDYCDEDFPVGLAATNDCNETWGGNHSPIMSESMCIQAAEEAGATVTHATLVIPATLRLVRPKGCFKMPCPSDAAKTCYYFNDAGDTPGPASGKVILNTTAPVCHRPRYVNYTVPDTDTGDAGCPDGYRLIRTEDPCRQAQNCLGKEPGDEFRIGMNNATRHRDHPYGCFVAAEDDKVYINEASRMGSGPSVTGRLICKVKISSRTATNYKHSADYATTAAPTVAP